MRCAQAWWVGLGVFTLNGCLLLLPRPKDDSGQFGAADADTDADSDADTDADTDTDTSGPTHALAVPCTDHPADIALVEIPAGVWSVGCTAGQTGCRADEEPVHDVVLTEPTCVAVYELGRTAFSTYMGFDPSHNQDCPTCPVENVSWCDAVLFSNALSAALGLEAAYSVPLGFLPAMSESDCDAGAPNVGWVPAANGYRLLTEGEWEVAARADTDLLYSGSDTPQDVGWYDVSSGYAVESLPVGVLAPNGWGLYDMSGNVNEWVWDRYGDYSASPVTDPAGASSGDQRVNRGGNYAYGHDRTRVSWRDGDPPGRANPDQGFRVGRNAPP